MKIHCAMLCQITFASQKLFRILVNYDFSMTSSLSLKQYYPSHSLRKWFLMLALRSNSESLEIKQIFSAVFAFFPEHVDAALLGDFVHCEVLWMRFANDHSVSSLDSSCWVWSNVCAWFLRRKRGKRSFQRFFQAPWWEQMGSESRLVLRCAHSSNNRKNAKNFAESLRVFHTAPAVGKKIVQKTGLFKVSKRSLNFIHLFFNNDQHIATAFSTLVMIGNSTQ